GAAPWRSLKRLLLAFVGLLALGLQPLGAEGLPTLDKTLANGMRIVVFEDSRSPTALQMVWIRAGSMDETDGKSGIAHVLEHMMFKGTKTLGPGEFSKKVSALGGRENAFTSREYTGYFQQVHRDALFEVMALEADRMQNLVINDDEFAKELKVVMEERRLRTDDSPQGRSFEALMATAFMAHPIRRPIIGWMSDLEQLTANDARDWYAQWYRPQYATLVVVGNVNAQAVFDKAQALYAGWGSSTTALNSTQAATSREFVEPTQLGPRTAEVTAPAENPFFIDAWKAPVLGSGDGPLSPDNPKARDVVALSVLASLLDDPNTGILVQSLVRQRQLALGLGVSSDTVSRGPGLFTITGSPRPGRSIQELQTAIDEVIKAFLEKGVSEAQLERIRRQAKASQVYQQDSLFSRAMVTGRLAMTGRPLSDRMAWLVMLDEIKADDLNRVAAQVLRDENRTTITLKPTDPKAAARRGLGSSILRH
ncbi:MAG: M16 family metallopeptidase, partial [Burkholderiaceae bacterium]